MHFRFHCAWMRAAFIPLCCGLALWLQPAISRAEEPLHAGRASDVSSATNQSLALDDPTPNANPNPVDSRTTTTEPGRDDAEVTTVSRTHRSAMLLVPRRADDPRESNARADVPTTNVLDVKSLGALAVVLLLLGVAVYLLRRYVPGFRPVDHDALKVVARTGLSPKHSLALVRVGRRYVLVGMAGDHVSPVCEMTDPQEVAELTAQVGKAPRGGRDFEELFLHEVSDHRKERQSTLVERSGHLGGATGDGAKEATGLVGLRSKLRSLRAG